MALHGAQGPQPGLPQMISSRVQFGVYGAAIPIVFVCIMYRAARCWPVRRPRNCSMCRSHRHLHLRRAATLLGYRAIHIVGRVTSVIGVLAFVFMFARLFAQHDIGALLGNRHFSVANFLLAMSLSASWQIAFGPYVADYSRYLLRSTSSARTFLAVGLGSVIGAQVSMVFGVFAAALAGQRVRASRGHVDRRPGHERWCGRAAVLQHRVLQADGDDAQRLRQLHVDGNHRQRLPRKAGHFDAASPRLYHRHGGNFDTLALAGRHAFLKEFTTFILFLLAFFTPWSVINLVDYYCFTHSRYDVPALSDPDGRYGRWNVTAIAIYALGVLVHRCRSSRQASTPVRSSMRWAARISHGLSDWSYRASSIYYTMMRRADRSYPAKLILSAGRE